MGRYKKILVAIDGSEYSLHALKESLKFSKEEKCWVTVVSVIPRYEGDLGSMWINNVKGAMRKPCEKALSEAERIAGEEEIFIKIVCEEGEIYKRIVDLVDAEDCDLIVMGRKGFGGFEKTLVGSVTARVIGYTQRDVLIVPEDAHVSWKNILLATDGSRYSEAATNRAIDFAKSHGGNVNALSVVNVPPEFYSHVMATEAVEDLIKKAKGFVEDVKKRAEAQGVQTEISVREGEAWQVITDFAQKQNIDIIVIGSHGRTGLKRLLMGSIAERVIGHAACPVLVIKS